MNMNQSSQSSPSSSSLQSKNGLRSLTELLLETPPFFSKENIICKRHQTNTMAAVATTTPAGDTGRVAFVPLEANPQLMSDLLHKLGLSQELAVHDVYSLHDAEMLAFVPRPALALLLVFPVSAAYESFRLAEDATLPEYKGCGEDQPVIWFRQTIRNACGLMGLLHAASNGPAKDFVRKLDSLPSRNSTILLKRKERLLVSLVLI